MQIPAVVAVSVETSASQTPSLLFSCTCNDTNPEAEQCLDGQIQPWALPLSGSHSACQLTPPPSASSQPPLWTTQKAAGPVLCKHHTLVQQYLTTTFVKSGPLQQLFEYVWKHPNTIHFTLFSFHKWFNQISECDQCEVEGNVNFHPLSIPPISSTGRNVKLV